MPPLPRTETHDRAAAHPLPGKPACEGAAIGTAALASGRAAAGGAPGDASDEVPARRIGHARTAAPVLLVRLRGSEAEMGAQHGRILRAAGGYAGALRYYPRMPALILSAAGRGGAAMRLLIGVAAPLFEAGLRSFERARPPDLLARTRAFFEALGFPPDRSRYIFVMDLLQNVIGLAGRLGLGPFAARAAARAPACSTLAVWGRASEGGAVRHARNFDFPGIGIWDRAPEVVLCSPERGLRYGFVTTRGAETPGVTAFNEAGLVLTAHTRLHRDICFDGAGIIDLGHEIVRRAETLAGALAVARERRVASSWGLAVSSAREGRAIVIETTAARVEAVEPADGEDFLPCANRYHHPATRAGELVPSLGLIPHSDGREAVLRSAAIESVARGGLGVADLEALLGSHAVAEAAGEERAAGSVVAQACTVTSVVADAGARRIHVSAGSCPAGRGPFVEVPWDFAGEVGAEEIVPPPVEAAAEDGASSAAPGRSRFAAGAAADGYARFLEAASLAETGGGLEPIRAAIEGAIALDPEEPVYRFFAGLLRLKALDPDGALAHLERGLARERGPFRRGQFLLWAWRAAKAAGRLERARSLREELLVTADPLLEEYRAAARAEGDRPLPKRRLRAIDIDIGLVDANLS